MTRRKTIDEGRDTMDAFAPDDVQDLVAAQLTVAAQVYLQSAVHCGRSATVGDAVEAVTRTWHLVRTRLAESPPPSFGELVHLAGQPVEATLSGRITQVEHPAVRPPSAGDPLRRDTARSDERADRRPASTLDAWSSRHDRALYQPEDLPFHVGQALLGRYRVVALGPVAHVFEAEEISSGRPVLVQALAPIDAAPLEEVHRALRARIDERADPTLPRVVGGGVHADETLWLALAAPALRPLTYGLDVLADPVTRVVAVARRVRQCALALAATHRLGVLHGGVAPDAFGLDEHGRVALRHFGIGWVARRGGAPPTVPGGRAGNLHGAALHLAPEQIQGDELDARTDVYALATVAWGLVAGHPLFSDHRSFMATCLAHLQDAPPSLAETLDADVPQLPRLARLIDEPVLGALAKQPSQRPESADALADGFEDVLASLEA